MNRSTLRAWLRSRNIDTSQWGSDGSKSIRDLMEELRLGESVLIDNPPRRVVNVARIAIRKEDQVLVHIETRLPDGTIRPRGYCPGEKIRKGEDPIECAMRGCREELSVEPYDAALMGHESSIRISGSVYPNLSSRYNVSKVEVWVEGLPDEDFTTREKNQIHLWGWRKE